MHGGPLAESLQKSLDSTKVEYVHLGKSGLRVSSPILGTMGIGSKQWMQWCVEEEEGLQILKAAWDRGELILLQPSELTLPRTFNMGRCKRLFVWEKRGDHWKSHKGISDSSTQAHHPHQSHGDGSGRGKHLQLVC